MKGRGALREARSGETRKETESTRTPSLLPQGQSTEAQEEMICNSSSEQALGQRNEIALKQKMTSCVSLSWKNNTGTTRLSYLR